MNTRKWSVLLIVAMVLLASAACEPQVVTEEVVVTQEVEREVEVTREVEREVEVVVTATPEPEETTLERVQREGVVRVGFANESPYAFAQPDGSLSGEAVEIARVIFERLGIEEMEGVLTEFGSLIPGLQANRFDAITAGMYVKPERCEQALFADPEYCIGEALIVEAGNPYDLHTYEDIAANPDVKVGTGAGYFEEGYLTAVGVSEDQIVLFPDGPSGVAGLQAGQIDVWTSTAPACIKLVETTGDPNLELAEPFTDPIIEGKSVVGCGATAFRREDVDFRNAFNAELTALKESGELLEIISQFEGFGEATLPGDRTVSDMCPDAYTDFDLD
jgi:polar amino acid transport system substrate-binding protein